MINSPGWRTTFRRLVLGLCLAMTVVGCVADDAQRVERAREHFERGEIRSAAIELKNVLRNDPSNVDARSLLGRVALADGDAEAAAKELQRARELGAEEQDYMVPLGRALLRIDRPDEVLDLDPDLLSDPRERANLVALHGNALLLKEDLDEAVDRFATAQRLQPDHAEALVGMARVQIARGERDKAEVALRRVIAREPDLAVAHGVLGRLQMDAAQYEQAEASLQAAVEAAQSPALVRERLMYLGWWVEALLAQGKAARAQQIATIMIDIAPNHPMVLFQAARADFESGDYDEVILRTQQIIASYPEYEAARMLLAAAALAKENFALAETHLSSLASAHPNNVEVGKLLAQARMNLGSAEAALEALQPLLDAGSNDPRVLAMAGSASLLSGRRAEGLDFLARGVESGGSDLAIQQQAVSSLIEAGEPRRALQILDGMPQQWRDLNYAALRLAALLDTGAVDEARALADEVVTQHPQEAEAYRIAATFHTRSGENPAARALLSAGLELDPDNRRLLMSLTRLDLADGRVAEARTRFEQRLQKDPGDLLALITMAQIFESEGDLEGAVAFLEQARKRNPDSATAPITLSRYYVDRGNIELAMERAEQAVSVAPQDGEALTALGKAQIEAGRHSEALGTLERAVRYAPNFVDARFELARAQFKLGLADGGAKSLREVLRIDPEHLGARVSLTRLESLRGNYAAALKTAASLKQNFPDRAEPEVLEGDIHIMRKHYNDAIAAYDRAARLVDNRTITIKRYDARRRAGRADSHEVLEDWLTRHPDDLQVLVTLAQAYAENGHPDKAIASYEEVLRREPDNLVALNNLAWIYADAGGAANLEKGLAIARRAHESVPTNGAVADTYGWLLLKQGKLDRATSVLRQAARDEPDNPDIRYHLAVALHRAGASQEAKELLDSTLAGSDDFPSRDEARELREKL